MNFLRVRRVHFVGIGGVGMSGLAEILASVGLTVTGSDLREGEETRRLRDLGIPVFAAGHRAEHPLRVRLGCAGDVKRNPGDSRLALARSDRDCVVGLRVAAVVQHAAGVT